MMYQPKSVDKMTDFEKLTLCIRMNSSQMCAYFCKDVVTGYCLYLLKHWIANHHSFQHFVAMGLTSCETRV